MTSITSQLFPSSQRFDGKPSVEIKTKEATDTQEVAYANTKELKDTASAAITSSYFFNEKLGVLLGELRKSKENLIKQGAQKEFIDQAEEFSNRVAKCMFTMKDYQIRLHDMYNALAGDSSKGIKSPSNVVGASSDAIKMSQDLVEKLAAFSTALHKGKKNASEKEQEQIHNFYQEVQDMKAEVLKMQGELLVIHWTYKGWPTNETKGVTSGKAVKSGDEVLITDLNKILTSSNMIKSDLRHLAIAIGQFGAETEMSIRVEADVQHVNFLVSNMEAFEKGIEQIYKKFGTIYPPVDIIDKSAGAGSKTVYDTPGSIADIIKGIEKKIENLNIQLKNLAFALAAKYNQSQPNEQEKYLTALEFVKYLSGYLKDNVTLKLADIKEHYEGKKFDGAAE